jgi:hypothetical protein
VCSLSRIRAEFPKAIDRVRIQTPTTTVEVPWRDWLELRRRLQEVGQCAALIDAFEKAGTSRPVIVDRADEAPLVAALVDWINDLGWTISELSRHCRAC